MSDIRFEERLLQELRGVVAAHPAPAALRGDRAHRPRRLLAGLGGVAAVVVVAIALATSGGGVEPAYAVERQQDGTVTVRISSLRDADGLERALRAKGVPAVVSYGTSDASCSPGGAAPPAGTDDGPSTQVAPGQSANAGPSFSTSGQPRTGKDVRGKVTSAVSRDADGVRFSIDPGTLGDGEKVYITTSTGAVDTIGMSIC